MDHGGTRVIWEAETMDTREDLTGRSLEAGSREIYERASRPRLKYRNTVFYCSTYTAPHNEVPVGPGRVSCLPLDDDTCNIKLLSAGPRGRTVIIRSRFCGRYKRHTCIYESEQIKRQLESRDIYPPHPCHRTMTCLPSRLIYSQHVSQNRQSVLHQASRERSV
jgi:hypothetical protein